MKGPLYLASHQGIVASFDVVEIARVIVCLANDRGLGLGLEITIINPRLRYRWFGDCEN